MKSLIVLIFYIFGVYCVEQQQNNQNVTNCDQNIESMDLKEVIYLAVDNKTCRNDAMELISWKYNFTEVYVESNLLMEKGILHVPHKISEEFWKIFGHTIKVLQFSCYFYKDIDPQQIANLTSLKNIYFEYFHICKFSPEKPYETVEFLTVNDHNAPGPAARDLNQIFPKLRILKTEGYQFLFDGKFPDLTSYEALLISNSANFTEFFKNNPQIKTLHVPESRIEYLKAAHDLLPHLKNVTFIIPKDFRSYNETIFSFPNVTVLTIKDEFQTFDHSKLNFESLEELNIDMGSTQLIENEWIRFIGNHTNLKSITTTRAAYFDANGLSNVSKVADLVKANIYIAPLVEDEDIITFVKNSKSLQKFRFNFRSPPSEDDFLKFVVRLRGKLDEKWKLNQDYYSKRIELINLEKIEANEQVQHQSNGSTMSTLTLSIAIILCLNLFVTNAFSTQ